MGLDFWRMAALAVATMVAGVGLHFACKDEPPTPPTPPERPQAVTNLDPLPDWKHLVSDTPIRLIHLGQTHWMPYIEREPPGLKKARTNGVLRSQEHLIQRLRATPRGTLLYVEGFVYPLNEQVRQAIQDGGGDEEIKNRIIKAWNTDSNQVAKVQAGNALSAWRQLREEFPEGWSDEMLKQGNLTYSQATTLARLGAARLAWVRGEFDILPSESVNGVLIHTAGAARDKRYYIIDYREADTLATVLKDMNTTKAKEALIIYGSRHDFTQYAERGLKVEFEDLSSRVPVQH